MQASASMDSTSTTGARLFGRHLLATLVAGGALAALHWYRTRHYKAPPSNDAMSTSSGDDPTASRHCDALREHLSRYSLGQDDTTNGRDSVADGYSSEAFRGSEPVPAVVEEHLDDALPVQTITPYKPARRSTVSGPSTNLAETRRYRARAHPKSNQEAADLRRWLRTCHLFTQLDDDEIGLVIDAMSRVDFVQGSCVTLQGDAVDGEADRFMVIAEGEVSVIKDGTVLRVLRQGQFFGERHLMFVNSVWRLTHRVETPRCRCFALAADDYRHIVTRVAVDKSELYEGFLDRVTWLKGLTHREKMQLADSLQAVIYNDGDYLIEYDTIGVWLYLIVEGQVEVYGRQHGEIVSVCTFGPGDCVGELEFLNNHRTVADVRAKGRVKAARLHRDHFEMCMGPIVDVLRRCAAGDERFAYYRALIDTHPHRSVDASGGDSGSA